MTTATAVTTIPFVTLEVADPAATLAFCRTAFGVDKQVRARAAQAASSGFRGFTLSLVVAQPSTVDSLVASALAAGAVELKPARKSFWGYGGVVQAPDGTVWKVASSAKKNTGPAERRIDDLVLLLGVADVKASKRFYIEHGLSVANSFGSKYVEFETASSQVKLALYGRAALAKDAGVAAEGTGSHRIVIAGVVSPFTDPDGFVWEPASR